MTFNPLFGDEYNGATMWTEDSEYHLTTVGCSSLKGEQVVTTFGNKAGNHNPVTKALRRKRGLGECFIVVNEAPDNQTDDVYISSREVIWDVTKPSILVVAAFPKPFGPGMTLDRETSAAVRHADKLGAGGVKLLYLSMRETEDVVDLGNRPKSNSALLAGSYPGSNVSNSGSIHAAWLLGQISQQITDDLPVIFAWGDATTRAYLLHETATKILESHNFYKPLEDGEFGAAYSIDWSQSSRGNPVTCTTRSAPKTASRTANQYLIPIRAFADDSPIKITHDNGKQKGVRRRAYLSDEYREAGVRSYQEVADHLTQKERDETQRKYLTGLASGRDSVLAETEAEAKKAMAYVANERDEFYSNLDAVSIF